MYTNIAVNVDILDWHTKQAYFILSDCHIPYRMRYINYVLNTMTLSITTRVTPPH
jgi:hypothetical protein